MSSARGHLLLWDRLSSEPEAPSAPLPNARHITGSLLRESVRRELSVLFNTTALSAVEPLDRLVHAERSVINYGLPDLTGKTSSGVDRPWLEQKLARAIRDFEPRLRPDSVRVNVAPHQPLRHNLLSFEIEAVLADDRDRDPVRFSSELDLESGAAVVREHFRA
jgi:type VI secretion system protein ImpF